MSDAGSDTDERRLRPHRRLSPLRLARFFLIGIGVADPLVLRLGVGLHQASSGSLHRTAQAMEEFPHMARMLIHAKLFPNDAGQDRRGPDPRIRSEEHTSE